MDLYRATPTVTQGLSFSGHIRRTALFSRLLRHRRECGESILTQIQSLLRLIFYMYLCQCLKIGKFILLVNNLFPFSTESSLRFSNNTSLDHPDYSVYDCSLPRNVWGSRGQFRTIGPITILKNGNTSYLK
jgi:hypothetical protein